jgi:hypothetical protein
VKYFYIEKNSFECASLLITFGTVLRQKTNSKILQMKWEVEVEDELSSEVLLSLVLIRQHGEMQLSKC